MVEVRQAASGAKQLSERVVRRRSRKVMEILNTAATLFGERGYEGVSVEDVADRLDVTKSSLYYYFPSKDELVAAAIETLGNDWTVRLEAVVAGTAGTCRQRLRALVHEHLTVAVREHPAALRLFLEPREWPPALHDRIKDLRRRHDAIFRTLIEEGLDTGEFAVLNVDTTLQCLHAAMSQAPVWCSDLRDGRQRAAIADLTDTLMMLVGVLPLPSVPT